MSKSWVQKLILVFAISVLIYCVTVIGFITTSPDIGLRCLLQGNSSPNFNHPGVEIHTLPWVVSLTEDQPRDGDILLRVGQLPIRTYRDFPVALNWLRTASPTGQPLYVGDDPYATGESHPRPVINVEGTGTFVEIEYLSEADGATHRAYLHVQSIPWSALLITLVWFVLQLGLTGLSGVAYWNRPFDHAARVFFLMTLVTMGAFVGGYHWWLIAGHPWLNFPFMASAIFVPVTLLHFSLIYPRADVTAASQMNWLVKIIYLPAAVSLLFFVATLAELHSSGRLAAETGDVQRLVDAISRLQWGINGYLSVSAFYFIWTIAVLIHSYQKTRNMLEQRQLWWMLCAGIFALLPVGYTLYLALYDRSSFALGNASVPMFVAGLAFMLAYLVGMIRYKLLLIDQLVDKGMRFYVASTAIAIGFGMVMATGSIIGRSLNYSPQPQQVLSVFLTMVFVSLIMLWVRDRLQQFVDHYFFREKYRLDQLLNRVNRSVGHLVDRETLAERLLNSCRDVLRVTWAAFYLRDRSGDEFQLVNSSEANHVPMVVPADAELMSLLEEEATWQREQGRWREDSPVQNLLHVLKADLIQTLTGEDEILGLVVLGPRVDQSPYGPEDVAFLQALSHVTTVALQTSKIHQDLSALNEELVAKSDQLDSQQRQIALLQNELARQQPTPPAVVAGPFHRGAIKGNSTELKRVLDMAHKAARSDATILVRGESGCGKELLALAIHENSPRAKQPLVPVHCAALSPTLLESELFGHVRGAFTGAQSDRVGRFEMAHGGTLFLDEIGDISPETQIKLLRVLQDRSFEPVGSSRTVHVDVRLIAATHQNLEKLIAEGRFREDLYYRLNVVSLVLPSLRERPEDIFELTWHFLRRACHRTGKRLLQLEPEVVSALEHYHWPGNIRELENVIERAVVLSEGDSLTLRELPLEVLQKSPRRDERMSANDAATKSQGKRSPRTRESISSIQQESATLKHVTGTTSAEMLSGELDERQVLETALRQADGNMARAARSLGIPRSTFFSRLKKHGLK